WNDPFYTWSADNKKVTGHRICYNDPTHEETETVSASYSEKKAPTCEDAGEGLWTSEEFENPAFPVQKKKVTIPALGHDLVKTEAKKETCTEPGNTAYWTCTRCGKYFSDAEGKTEIEEGSWVIPATGHDWDSPEYTWSADNKTVTASRVCYTDRSHKETETVSANFSVTKAATCEETGEGLWTSDAFQNEAFKVQKKKVTIAALGHDWDAPVFTWEGYESAKASRTCKRDDSHTETVDCEITSEVTREETAWEEGVRTYTAAGTFQDGTVVTDTKTEAIPAYGWKWTRLSEKNRYGTMATIIDEAYPEEEAGKCTTLIVATGESFPDALAGSALAGVYGCPVILTKTATLSPQAESEIRRLMDPEGCTVLILGGDAAVTPDVEEAIKAIDEHIIVERVMGTNRDKTAIAVYEKAFKDENGKSTSDTVIIATGFNYADALSISPYAYAAKAPILLAKKDGSLSSEVKELLEGSGIKKALIVGGTNAVSAASEKYLTVVLGMTVQRLSGSNRYKTSAEIIRWELGLNDDAAFQPEVTMTNAGMGVATGENFADALASVSLLGKNGSILLLASDKKLDLLEEHIDAFIKPFVKEMQKGYIFGGTVAVVEEIEDLLNAAIE
ncbi:MAG: cell wall-binding repeat-containing protein, partial [Lachnospiraceae bacterium]|nr:cell wall-binding repeat-containing protein [Lachnospiraceae bacterium]